MGRYNNSTIALHLAHLISLTLKSKSLKMYPTSTNQLHMASLQSISFVIILKKHLGRVLILNCSDYINRKLSHRAVLSL